MKRRDVAVGRQGASARFQVGRQNASTAPSFVKLGDSHQMLIERDDHCVSVLSLD